MKQIIICSIIVAFVLILNMITQNYTKQTVEEMTHNLNILKEDVISKKKEESGGHIDQTLEKWESRYEVLSYYIEHNELEKVKTQLIELKSNLETQEYSQAAKDIETSKFLLQHINQKISLQIKNIF